MHSLVRVCSVLCFLKQIVAAVVSDLSDSSCIAPEGLEMEVGKEAQFETEFLSHFSSLLSCLNFLNIKSLWLWPPTALNAPAYGTFFLVALALLFALRKASKKEQVHQLLDSKQFSRKLDDIYETGECVWDHFKKGKRLGFGASGEVFAATCRSGHEKGKQYAVKCIRKYKIEGDFAVDGASEELRLELEILANLDHPNIITLKAVFDDAHQDRNGDGIISEAEKDADGDGIVDGSWYLVMEMAQGGEVIQRLVDGSTYSQAGACNVIREAAQGLSYMHSHGIAHRDIKPENVMFMSKSRASRIVLVDLGLAAPTNVGIRGKDSRWTETLGTPNFMAPEIFAKEGCGPPADIWALGVTLYLIIFAEMPWKDTRGCVDYARMQNGLRHEDLPPEAKQEANPPLLKLLQGMLEVDPGKRMTADEVLASQWVTHEAGLHQHALKKKRNLVALLERLRKKLRTFSKVAGKIASSISQIRRHRTAAPPESKSRTICPEVCVASQDGATSRGSSSVEGIFSA